MITKKLWNSFTKSTRGLIMNVLAQYDSVLEQPYNHDFDFDLHGKRLKEILSKLYTEGKNIRICRTIVPEISVVSPKPKTATKVVSEPKVKTFIGHYHVHNEDGEVIDDFNEWCHATCRSEAESEFKDRYYRSKRITLVNVWEE